MDVNSTSPLNIAAILTCHDRRAKTLACLESLFRAVDSYDGPRGPLRVSVFLTDDGCSDGTAQAVQEAYPSRHICITRSEDDLFWARGMCLSWRTAMEEGTPWDYYLLLNDDTRLLGDAFPLLFDAQEFCLQKTGREGLTSGVTVSPDNPSVTTYGGMRWRNRWLGINEMVVPKGEPMPCDETNANILLVPSSVVQAIGIFHDGYRHSCADYDYSLMAGRQGIPSFVMGLPCGTCEFDHHDQWGKQNKIVQMTRAERRAYFNHPLNSSADHLLFVRRNMPLRYPLVWLGRWMNIYCPGLYNRLTGFRFKY